MTLENNMNQIFWNAVRYVENTRGCATKAHFIDDHEPVGAQLWDDLKNAGLVFEDKYARIVLTAAGAKLLEA